MSQELEQALPVEERPHCRWCGKKLRPHYDTRTERGPAKWRKLRPTEMKDGADPHDEDAEPKSGVYTFFDDEYHYPEYRKGCWRLYYESEVVVSRKFLGDYGFRDLFCNQSCAQLWAVVNLRKMLEGAVLSIKGTFYVSSKYNERVHGTSDGKD